jgi:hypothetical protein
VAGAVELLVLRVPLQQQQQQQQHVCVCEYMLQQQGPGPPETLNAQTSNAETAAAAAAASAAGAAGSLTMQQRSGCNLQLHSDSIGGWVDTVNSVASRSRATLKFAAAKHCQGNLGPV